MPIMVSVADGDDLDGGGGIHGQGGGNEGVGEDLHTPPDHVVPVPPDPAGETVSGHGHVPRGEERGLLHSLTGLLRVGQKDRSLVNVLPNMNSNKVNAENTHRTYLLNDVGALRKKLSQESNKEPFSQGKEAKDGFNICF